MSYQLWARPEFGAEHSQGFWQIIGGFTEGMCLLVDFCHAGRPTLPSYFEIGRSECVIKDHGNPSRCRVSIWRGWKLTALGMRAVLSAGIKRAGCEVGDGIISMIPQCARARYN